MTPEEIAKDKAICDGPRVTGAPWLSVGRGEIKSESGFLVASMMTSWDAPVAAHCRNRLPAYIAEAEEMAARITALREQIRRRDESDRYDDQRGFTNGLREALAAITGGQ